MSELKLSNLLGAISLVMVLVIASNSFVFGQETWRRVYGAYDEERCIAVRAISSTEFILAGTTGSFGSGSSDIYLMNVDGSGNHQWSKTLGSEWIEQARDLRVLPDGGFIIAGTTNSGDNGGYDALLIRTNSDGEILWEKSFGGEDWDFFNQVKIVSTGGFIIAGQTFSSGEPGGNAWLVRLDDEGEVIWERTLGGSGLHTGMSASEVPDNGFIIVGSLADGDTQGFAARYGEEGEMIWVETYGGDSIDIATDVVVCQDGGFSIVGSTSSYSPHMEAWHFKIDENGEEIWFHNWGQINDQESFEHYELSDGNYITIGYTKTSGGGGKDMFLLKSDSEGQFIFGRTFGGFYDDEGFGLDVLDDGFICGGYSNSFGFGSSDYYLVRTGVDGTTESEEEELFFDPLSNETEMDETTFSIYPNPSSGSFTVESTEEIVSIKLMNLIGQVVLEENKITGNYFEVNIPAGRYILQSRLRSGESLISPLQIIR